MDNEDVRPNDTIYKLSVVIPVYNGAETIGEQLEALANQRWHAPWELLIVNNRCIDNTVDIAQSFRHRFERLLIVDAFARQGAAYALNTGMRAATADAVAFCDADDVVADGWVPAMGEALQKHPFVSGPLETRRLNTSPLTIHRNNAQSEGVQAYSYPPYLPHAGAGNMGVRRDLFETVGGFDESLQTLFETDFCWKVQLRGTPLTPVRDAVVHVRHRDRVRDLLRQARKYAEYDVALYKRYRPLGMPPLSLKTGLRAWIDLGLHVGDVMREERRARYLWDLGWRTGRLYGSIKHRVLAL